ncbi:MAG: F0F1 ATP synthase subunit gamma [Cardiobacteriaceae bacterium]|nr:F0F1 ATP synthase subunit gamma [Cardiobacteriaceae bacterium]MBR1375127.1 F0F1 ATP synthase subunit gamma [Cardiobacteriaceae bacterium]
MSNAKEIRGQIKSVKNTQKITRAMEMVAASKVRRVQEQMRVGRPYTQNLLRVINHLVKATSGKQHPYLTPVSGDVKKVGYIIVSTDRGLCGGLNINLFKTVMQSVREEKEKGHEIVISVFGRKGAGFVSRIKAQLLSCVENYPEDPKITDLIGGINPIVEAYEKGELQKVFVAANIFENAMSQKPSLMQLLPASVSYADEQLAGHSWDYLYDSNPEVLLSRLLKRYIESLVKQAVLENIASEMSARMVAMKSASDNAGNLINELQLRYNKARQAAITQELTEIVAGADAV